MGATVEALAVIVGSALLFSGFGKVRDPAAARVGVLDYRIVPVTLALPIGVVIGASELVVGAGVVLGSPLASALAVLLLGLFSLVAASALIRHLDIDCHCGGEGQRLGLGTLSRNAVLTTALTARILAGANTSSDLRLLNGSAEHALGVAAALAMLIFAFVSSRLWSIGTSIGRGTT